METTSEQLYSAQLTADEIDHLLSCFSDDDADKRSLLQRLDPQGFEAAMTSYALPLFGEIGARLWLEDAPVDF